jgi:ubiquitin carboxyl-terminal hydrolase 22/27/51
MQLMRRLTPSHKIYSEDPNPHGPITFLATTWRASAELSGYAQQDAHEFFISALNQIHTTSRGSTNVSCNCIIHSTFAGQLQSDVKCERCGNVTSTVDPMLDISLELKGKMGETSSGENTLAACLRRYVLCLIPPLTSMKNFCPIIRFTQPEKLGPKEYSCGKCGKASHVCLTIMPLCALNLNHLSRKLANDSVFGNCHPY